MRKKLGKGEKFNMKVVICGDVCTGKTSLFHKLQGLPMKEEYTPSTSVQCGHAHWAPQRSEDIVKVEVVDVPVAPSTGLGRKVSMTDAIKFSSTSKGGKVQGSFVIEELAKENTVKEVARSSQAALVCVNPKVSSTYDFAVRLLNDLPPTTFICVMAQFHDEKGQWQLSREQMEQITQIRANTYFLECSNVSNFGLQAVYKFLELPFLLMQREVLLKKIEINALETQLTETDLKKLLHANANPADVLPAVVEEPSEDEESGSQSDHSPAPPVKRKQEFVGDFADQKLLHLNEVSLRNHHQSRSHRHPLLPVQQNKLFENSIPVRSNKDFSGVTMKMPANRRYRLGYPNKLNKLNIPNRPNDSNSATQTTMNPQPDR
eukprot:c9958_g1_i1.p1 GENE.c9958_g1_i1~~c9958_g1_i1.p1  ORF type:complete len:405 (-),score=85.50 c9958_g1_i1:730-1857(-)